MSFPLINGKYPLFAYEVLISIDTLNKCIQISLFAFYDDGLFSCL